MRPRMGQPPNRPSRNKRRMWALQICLLAALGLVAWRVQYDQQVYGSKLLADASVAQDRDHVLLAPRGAILDSSGNRLAYDVPAFRLDVKASAFPDVSALATILAPALGVKPTDSNLLDKLNHPGLHGWIEWSHPILEPAKDQILAALSQAQTQDVTFTPTEERFYPYGAFAANTIGFVNQAGVGQGGIESEYNSQMVGQNGTIQYTQDAEGFPIPTSVTVTKPSIPGENVQLTIDETVQGFVEHEMDNLVTTYHPEHAAIIVTNPNTGAILGMSSRPTFNPNAYAQASAEALSTNWAVNSRFEPGSTFKVLVLAAALATHSVTLQDTFESGHMNVKGRQINDWNGVGWGRITFEQALEYSSNVGFATIASKLGWPNLLHYMDVFGFTRKTGVDLPNEASSLLFPQSEQGPVQLATSGFGQGIAVTPLQQIAAIGAIANGGKLMKPYITQALTDAQGHPVKRFGPTVVNPQVVPPNVVAQVNNTMALDVSKGIDAEAVIPGYDVAGKTGTAQAVDPTTGQYYADRFIVSFIGYAPAEHPQVEVYVTLYWPKTTQGNQWGSTVATPAARNILQECLQYYHVPPVGAVPTRPTQSLKEAASTTYVETPNLVGRSKAQATLALHQLGLTPIWMGGTGAVQSQWPSAGIQVEKSSKVYMWLPSGATGTVVVPDLTGVSMRDAGNMMTALGLHFAPTGSGFVTSQSPAAGQTVTRGATVSATFSPPSTATVPTQNP